MFKKEKPGTKNKVTPIFGQLWNTDYNKQAAEYFIDQSITFVENHEGLKTEGIFRLCGVKPKIEALKFLVDKDPLHFQFEDSTDVHEVTGCMKLFLREMPIPLLTYELYDAFIAATATEIESERPVILKKCLELLPPFNKIIFKKLCLFLNRIIQNSAITFMNAANLATCISPNILKPESNDITILINDAPLQCLMMSIIVTEAENFFKSGPWVGGGVTIEERRTERIVEEKLSMSLPPMGTPGTVAISETIPSDPTSPRNSRWTTVKHHKGDQEEDGDHKHTLLIHNHEKKEIERDKVQTLITPVMEQPETEEEEKKISNDEKLKSDIKKRIEFFEQMVKDGGLEISPESGALVAAMKNEMIRKALTPLTPQSKKESPKQKLSQRLSSSPHLPKMVLSKRTPPTSPRGKFERTKSEHKLQNELHKAIGKKEKEKKKK